MYVERQNTKHGKPKNSILRLKLSPISKISPGILCQLPRILFPYITIKSKDIRHWQQPLVHPPQQSLKPPKHDENDLKHKVPAPVKNPPMSATPAAAPKVVLVVGWLGFGLFGVGFGAFVALVLERLSVFDASLPGVAVPLSLWPSLGLL
jgi:hypothetical protein